MLRILILISVLFSGFQSFATGIIVEGPYKVKGVSELSVGFERNDDHSISFLRIFGVKSDVIDTYAVGDGEPKIETVFFDKVGGVNKILVLVSWDEENISAIHYKVKIYNYNMNGDINDDAEASADENLEGYDGYSGGGAIFNLKNVATIKNISININDEILQSMFYCS